MAEQTDLKQEVAGLPISNTIEVMTSHKFFIACTTAETGCSGGDGKEAAADWLYNKICPLKPGSVFMVFLVPFDAHKRSGLHQLLENVTALPPVF